MDCGKYLNCWNGLGDTYNCPKGTLFNPENLRCDHLSKVVCASKDKPTNDINGKYSKRSAKLTDGQPRQYNPQSTGTPVCPSEFGLFPHPLDCSKFLNCGHGIMHIQYCGRGTVFNPISKFCDWPENVDCEIYTRPGTIAPETREIFTENNNEDLNLRSGSTRKDDNQQEKENKPKRRRLRFG